MGAEFELKEFEQKFMSVCDTNEQKYQTTINDLKETIKQLSIKINKNLGKIEHIKTEFQWDHETGKSHLVYIIRLTTPQSNVYLSLINNNTEQKIPYSFLEEHWTLVYNKPFNHPTTVEELRSLISQCTKNIIVAAAEKDLKVLTFSAYGPKNVLELNTTQNEPVKYGDVYWYLTPPFSFGFSPTQTIKQTVVDEQGDKRLSWFLDGFTGGYRVGMKKMLNDNLNCRKIIFTLRSN
ncbi:unnamed protein product [Didymodactylos carnosus]|uniref:Uncharacterized protein n=1 Tax=Didymodactylos carnosus TaxID=1234261 RepID=A0A815YVJ0_9BILA|nr:unnamed protein product [Didymodactylos carnosus]CAF4441426.1 unnamed protein product [Didymodactylos carnosus]